MKNVISPWVRRSLMVMLCAGFSCNMMAQSPAVDADADGLPDDWELLQFGDLSRTGQEDPDGDGVPNALEFASGRNPNFSETVAGRPDWQGLPGVLRLERWNGIAGASLAQLFASSHFYEAPDAVSFLTSAEMPPASINADNYGVRVRGTLRAPVTGNYRFWIASDDMSELWLGTGERKMTRRRIACSPAAVGQRQWNAFSDQVSAPIHLIAGQKYYLESCMKEAAGGDHLSLGWTYTPDDTSIPAVTSVQIIPGRLPDAEGTPVLESDVPDPDDQDDDGLSDAWERTVGLNPGDNGRINSADGAYADPDGDGFSNYLEWLSGGNPFQAGGNSGYVRRDIWRNLGGGAISQLTGTAAFARPASVTDQVSAPLSFSTYGDYYGQRVRGMVVPPRSGNWRFWIACDDAGEFWLSSNEKPSGKRKQAFVSGWTAPGAYDVTPSQKSASVSLSANQPYYFEILHKEAAGSDHVSVAWAYEATNWALASGGATASQSSTGYSGDPSRAIDGNSNGNYSLGSVTHTNGTANSWWQVDLGQNRPVNRVVLWNRTDGYQGRLSNFRISVRDADGVELIGQNFFPPGGGYAPTSFVWNLPQAVQARSIRVSLQGLNNDGNGYLSLAEVQAFEWVSEADRQVIPVSALRSAVPDPDDLDGDSLPDSWEQQYGLNPADNGSVTQSQGEYGDPDGDGVPNFLEFINQSPPNAPNGKPGQLQRDLWLQLAGSSLADLTRAPKFLLFPDIREACTSWPTSDRFSYLGIRYRGTYTPSVTGWHTFWISSYTNSALYLNDGSYATGPYAAENAFSRKFGKRLIATVGGEGFAATRIATGVAEFDKYPSQRSSPIWLTAGVPCYLEALHKSDVGAEHLAVGVQPPGAARTVVPFSALTSFDYDPGDVDDDDLPDIWESRYGLDPADNGHIRRGIEGALGDADGDQLTNREEYLLGTDPLNADSDGDSVSDFVEARDLHSDPTLSTSGLGSAEITLSGNAASPVQGQWIQGPNGSLLSLDRRGAVSWDFTLNQSGWHLLELLATPQGNTWAGVPLTLDLAVTRLSDARQWKLGAFPLRDDEGDPTRVLTLLPSLPAGNYRATVTLRNLSESRNVRVDRFRILSAIGDDANANGIPDWIETRLGQDNAILSAQTSPVSPACVEGIARDPEKSFLSFNGQNLPFTRGIDNRWFAAVPLPADGSPQAIEANFESSSLVQTHRITWTDTNLLTQTEPLSIRFGDSLRLTAHPAADATGTFQVSDVVTPAVTDLIPSAYTGYLPTTVASAAVAWPDFDLASIQKLTGFLQGGWIPTSTPAEGYFFSANGSSATFQLQLFDGTYTKVVKVSLMRTAGGVKAYQVYARYASGNNLGQNFDTLASSLYGNAPMGASGYGIPSFSMARLPLAPEPFTSSPGAASLPLPVRFTVPGLHALTATHTAEDGTVTTNTVEVRVLDLNFGTPFPVRSNRWRDWMLPYNLPLDTPLEWDSRLQVDEIAQLFGSRRLRVATTASEAVHLVARTAPGATIAARGTVDPYLIGDPYDTGYVELLETLPDGSLYGRISVVADRLPPGGYVEIQIWAGGAQFGNGATLKRLYAADFDANGLAYVNIYYPSKAALSSLCAYYRLYAANGTLLSGY